MELKVLATAGLFPSCSTSSSSSSRSGTGSRHPEARGSHHPRLHANCPTRSLRPERAHRRAMDEAGCRVTDPKAPATPGPVALQRCDAMRCSAALTLSPRRARRPPRTPGDYLCSAAGSKAHSGARRINRISPIYSLSQINPPPAPRIGRTRAHAPQGATFSPTWSSPHTGKPPLAPASAGEPQRTSVPPAQGPRCRGRVTSPAEAPSASSAQPCVSISSRAAAVPRAGGEGGEPRQSPARSFPSSPAPPDAAGAGGGPGAALAGTWDTIAVVGTEGQPHVPCPTAPAPPSAITPPQPYCSLYPPALPPQTPLQHYHPQPLMPPPLPPGIPPQPRWTPPTPSPIITPSIPPPPSPNELNTPPALIPPASLLALLPCSIPQP